LFIFNQFGDLEPYTLRPGNAHSAEGWRSVLNRCSSTIGIEGLTAISEPTRPSPSLKIYEMLEAEEIAYAIRLPANRVLQERITDAGHMRGRTRWRLEPRGGLCAENR
jgi:hypothetical protein